MALLIIGIILIITAIILGISDKSWGTFGVGLIIATMLFFCIFIFSLCIGYIAYETTPIENTIVSTETWSAVWTEEANDYIILNDDDKVEGVLSDYKNITVSNKIDSIEVYNDIYVFDDLDWLGGPLSHREGNRVRIIIPAGG